MSQTPDGASTQAAGQDQALWRIDDLAQRAGITVDTIRYYQREGLLPPAERAGRANLYSPAHLERLERIKELQGRRFSLAAIKALLTDEREGIVEGIFGGGFDRSYTLEELLERSGIDAELCEAVRSSGLLRDPAEFGREAYDGDDLDFLRTLAALHDLGMPTPAVVEIARTYAEGIEATQTRIIDLFTTGGALDWPDDELVHFQDITARNATDILPLARQLVDYTHQRTIQRLTLGAIERDVLEHDEDTDPTGPPDA
jgi:DNA-binding transcriptional MerR regulator